MPEREETRRVAALRVSSFLGRDPVINVTARIFIDETIRPAFQMPPVTRRTQRNAGASIKPPTDISHRDHFQGPVILD